MLFTVTPPATAGAAGIAAWVVGSETGSIKNRRSQGAKRIINETSDGAGVDVLIGVGDAKSESGVALSGNGNRSHPVGTLIAGVAGRWLVESARLMDARGLARSDSVQIIPTNAHARVNAARRPGIVHSDIRAGP